ncbi:alpha-1,2-mannosyltransferase ALG9-like isoform X1 [Salvelinus sp. IW2-2015]|uniref:alpha-1,2-mannosyltransferase ALG9-like isoform X1 n=1 Tax=Salvelinus sp. IW2-2015 TaxID=2691554 RepID=UPI0038D3ADA8
MCVFIPPGYHAPLDLYPEFHRISRDPSLHAVPKGRPVSVCVGKEWYRFPSSFLLPNNWQLQFIQSEFRGQLPQPYAVAHWLPTIRPHERPEPGGANKIRGRASVPLPGGSGPRDHSTQRATLRYNTDWTVIASKPF